MSLLLVSQKNLLFEYMQEEDLNPRHFALTDLNVLFKVIHPESGYYFQVKKGTHYIHITYSPSQDQMIEALDLVGIDFTIIANMFRNWLSSFNSEISLPNYWKLLSQQMNDIGTFEFVNSDYFTEDESKQVQEKLKLISKEISNLPLLTDQIQAINNKLDTIASNVKKLDKISWRDHLIGGIIGIVSQYAITPSNANLIWGILKSSLNSFKLLPL